MGTTNQTPATQEQKELMRVRKEKVSKLLQGYLPNLAQALPKFLTPEKMMRVALTAMNKNPKLLECTQSSLIGSILTSAQLGLLPDDVLGEAYLIPFNNTRKGVVECQFMVGYKGLCTLAYRSGVVQSVQARAVFKGDEFEHEFGLNEKLYHVPKGNKNPAEITHFYAVVRMKDGGHVFNVMTKEEVEQIRNESANYKFAKYKDSTVWGKYFEEMGCKTVLRRMMKYVPMSSEIARAVNLDEQGDYAGQNFASELLEIPEIEDEDLKEEMRNEIFEEAQIIEEEKKQEELFNSTQDGKKAEEDVLNKIKGK